VWAWLKRNWKIVVPVGTVLAAIGIWLFFFWFGFHTLFFDETVDEANPFEVSTTVTGDVTTTPDNPAEGTGPMDEVVETTAAADGPVTLATGDFVDRSHPTEGVAVVLSDGTSTILRLEGFRTDNGPDLNVYLSTAGPTDPATDFDEDFVDLGDLKGNVGDQNYEIPPEVDISRYNSVVIWCVRFTVAFGAAGLEHQG
jgi:hypothetical protein